MHLHFRRQCDKSNKHILCVQKPGKMSFETAIANPRCGLPFPKLRRAWKVAAVRKHNGLGQKYPYCTALTAKRYEPIIHADIYGSLSDTKGKRMRSGVRQNYISFTSYVTLGKPFPSPESQFPSSWIMFFFSNGKTQKTYSIRFALAASKLQLKYEARQ